MRLAALLTLLGLLGASAAPAAPGVVPADPGLMGQPGPSPRDYWVNTGGDWDEAPGHIGFASHFPTVCGTFFNYTDDPLRLMELGFSAVGEPSSSFAWGVYTDVGSMGPPPLAEPDHWGFYNPNTELSPYVSIDLSWREVYVAPGDYFSFYYDVPEYGCGLFDFNGRQGWYWGDVPRGWESLADYVPGFSPAFQFHGISSPANLYVCPEGGGNFDTIQEAVDAAGPGATVWLCDGVYSGQGNANIDFHGKRLVLRSESDKPEACVIELGTFRAATARTGSPDPGRRDRPWTDRGDRSGRPSMRAFVFTSGESDDSEVRGVTIRGGQGDEGGGIYVYHSSPTFRNCRFEDNFASLSGGGAAVVHSDSRFVDCVFEDNSTGMLDGGAVLAAKGSPSFEGCTFRGSWADYGGAMALYFCPMATVTDCHFESNQSLTLGGGLYATSGTGLVLNGCDFIDNEAGHQGGAVNCYMSEIDATGCSFGDNSALYGGGVSMGSSQGSFSGCLFWQNSASYGGALEVLPLRGEAGYPYTVTLENCTLAANRASGLAGGILFDGVNLSLDRVIIAHSPQGGSSYCNNCGGLDIQCTNVYDNADGDWELAWMAGFAGIAGNFEADPQFCGSDGNCQLQSDSPCLPGGNGCGALVGAFGQGCGSQAARPLSWSEVKSLY